MTLGGHLYYNSYMVNNSSKNHYSVSKTIWPILALLLLGAVVIALDGPQIRAVLKQADWRMLPPALLFTALSYLAVSYTYVIITQMLGIHMPSVVVGEICYVTTSLNHVVRSGGVAGYSLRILLMNPYGVEINDVLTSSLLHFYLTSLDMLLMLPVGIAYVVFTTNLSTGMRMALGLMTMLILVISIGSTLIVFYDALRTRLVEIILKSGKRILNFWHYYRPTPQWISRINFAGQLRDFNQHMTYGSKILRRQAGKTSLILLITIVDWISSVIVLNFCFNAFGAYLSVGAVVACFVIGIMAGVISALPGGIGVQEGSMTAIAMLMGIQFEQAILAVFLFRIVYYFIPYAVTPLFYWRLLHNANLLTSEEN